MSPEKTPKKAIDAFLDIFIEVMTHLLASLSHAHTSGRQVHCRVEMPCGYVRFPKYSTVSIDAAGAACPGTGLPVHSAEA